MEVKDALEMHQQYKEYWNENYREARIDLKMAAGDTATHWGRGWDDQSFNALPDNHPAIVINELPQFIHQVVNDIRQNTPSVKVIPEADGDKETADVFSGLIRAIEYKSCADEVYDTAADYAVRCGIGYILIDHYYANDEGDEQELIIKRVPDPLSVFLDPTSIECDGRDANGAVMLEPPITQAEFKRLYPGKKFVSFIDPKEPTASIESIVLAQVFVREYDGRKPVIKRYKFSGQEQLASTVFPGRYIPLIPVYGEESWIDSKRVLSSLIRQARSPSRRLNHWAVKESQLLSMAPVAPVMAPQGTLVNDRGQWQRPGSEMVLEYKQLDVNGDSAPPPTRLAPPPIPTGIINAMEGAKMNIKESLGMYEASLGERSNEKSGIAINARKEEGDVATFHFPDNVRRSINQVGRVLIEAIPTIYDTPRILQIVDEETEPQLVGVNGGPMQEGQQRPFDLTTGKYHVRVTTGASYTTKRQEAAQFLSDMFKQAPELLQIGGDLLFKNLDLPGAEALAARFKKTIPPNLLDDSEQPQIPPQITQQMQQMQQLIQQGAAEIQQLQAQLQDKQGDMQLKAGELAIKQQELKIKEMDLQIKAQQLQQPQDNGTEAGAFQLDAQKQQFDQSIKEREVALKEAEFKLKVMQAQQQAEAPQEQPKQPMGIKLDTTGFQMMKTPEQEALDAQSAQMEQQESEMKAQQANAVIQTLTVIAQQLAQLTAKVAEPKHVMRDPQTGMIVGVQ